MTLRVNLKGFQGKVSKKAIVYSDDPQSPQVTLKMEGTVVALIEVRPAPAVIFRGMADQVDEAVLELVGGAVPFHFTNSESSVKENINWKIEPVQDGKHYRLRISNKTRRGNYAGYVKLYTDLPQKPDLLVRVSGFIEGEVSVKPLTILIGKLSASQPARQGKVTVTSNRSESFEITKLGYDERLMEVEQHSLDDGAGFSIEITPKLDSVPVGARRQATLTIETSLNPGEKDTVQVHVFNSADQPDAPPKPR